VTALFATFLCLSLVCALLVALASPKQRRLFKYALLTMLLFSWISMALSMMNIVARTSSTLVTPGGARQPHLFGGAGREATTVLLSLGLPALIATVVGLLALTATRAKRQPR
jgi:disulfide bond formation protein DsbB